MDATSKAASEANQLFQYVFYKGVQARDDMPIDLQYQDLITLDVSKKLIEIIKTWYEEKQKERND